MRESPASPGDLRELREAPPLNAGAAATAQGATRTPPPDAQRSRGPAPFAGAGWGGQRACERLAVAPGGGLSEPRLSREGGHGPLLSRW